MLASQNPLDSLQVCVYCHRTSELLQEFLSVHYEFVLIAAILVFIETSTHWDFQMLGLPQVLFTVIHKLLQVLQ